MRTRTLVPAALIALAFVATTAPVVRTADTYPRQPGIRITNYTFDYTLTDASNELRVKQGVDSRGAVARMSAALVPRSRVRTHATLFD